MNNFNPDSSNNISNNNLDAPDLVDDCSETHGETHKNSRLALYIAFLALFFTALGITVGYKHWLRMHDKAKVALAEITVIKEQLTHTADSSKVKQLQASLTQSSSDAKQKLTDAIQELDEIRQQTTYSAKTVTDQITELTLKQHTNNPIGSALNSSMQAEIRFLLESAKRQLTISNNKTAALQLLVAADQMLIQSSLPRLLPVREKLAHDIVQLEQLSLPDIETLSETISQLEADIKPLSSLEKELVQGQKIDLFTIEDEESLTGKVKDYINQSVTLRKQTDPPRYALNNSDKERTDQLLKLRLESLRLMLMQYHNTAYHQQIKSIQQMLSSYYSPADAKPWLSTLNELDKENLTPAYPDISTALNQLIQTSSAARTAKPATAPTNKMENE